MTYEVFRCLEGIRAGCVDYLGEIEAANMTAAEVLVAETFDLSDNEHFDIQEKDGAH